jgi:vacuolar-type H+-ATPase subunit F/Vma7
MEIRLIGNPRDITSFGLAGIQGVECRTSADVSAALVQCAGDPAVAIVLVSHDTAALAPDAIERARHGADTPILVVLPAAADDSEAERPAA